MITTIHISKHSLLYYYYHPCSNVLCFGFRFLSASFLFLLRLLPRLHHLCELLLGEILVSVLVVFPEDEVKLPPVETVQSDAVLALARDISSILIGREPRSVELFSGVFLARTESIIWKLSLLMP